MPVKKSRRRSPWDTPRLPTNPQSDRALLDAMLAQEGCGSSQAPQDQLKAIHLVGWYVFDSAQVTSEDIRRFLWAGLRELRVQARANGWEEEEVRRLLVSAFDVFHDASASISAAMTIVASSKKTGGRGRGTTSDAATTASPGIDTSGSKTKTPPAAEHPALKKLNRAYLLQMEQTRAYRARRDADLDELEDMDAD